MTKSGQLWGGRFTGKPDETFAEFNDSFRFDRRLFAADVRASIAHANGLSGAGVLTTEETASITSGLSEMLEQADAKFFDDSDAEDVHSFVEGKLIASIAQSATSSAWSMRSRASREGGAGRLSSNGVSMSPGNNAHARTPLPRSSALIAWLSPRRPNFDIA